MYNFDLKRVEVQKLLEELEIRNVAEATMEEVRFSCPFPGHTSGDENPSAYMNKDSTAWICHGCKRKGNAITFMAELHNLSHLTATRFLEERFGTRFKYPTGSLLQEVNEFFESLEREQLPVVNYPLNEAVLEEFNISPPNMFNYLHRRGFTSSSILQWQLGYDKKSDRITIPIFNEMGRLVGIKGRALQPEAQPRYRVLGGRSYGFPSYHPGLVVYGVKDVPDDCNSAILVEGELNAVAMHQLGYLGTVAIGGSTFTQTHAKILIERFNSVLLFFDTDQAGVEATTRAAELLERRMPVYIAPDHEHDPADVLTWKNPRAYIDDVLSDARGTLQLMIDGLSA